MQQINEAVENVLVNQYYELSPWYHWIQEKG